MRTSLIALSRFENTNFWIQITTKLPPSAQTSTVPRLRLNQLSIRMASNNANAAFGRDGLFDLKGHVALVSGNHDTH